MNKQYEILEGGQMMAHEPTEMAGIDRGLEDIKNGNVFHAKNSADLVSQIFG